MARFDEGVKTAVEPPHDTVPETGVTPSVMVKLPVVTVPQATASENSAVIVALIATPDARSAGVVDDTVGDIVSTAAAVPNDHEKGAVIAFPARSVTVAAMVAV